MPRMIKGKLAAGGAVLALLVSTVGAYEGLRTRAYRDVVGVPTVCFGETRGVRMGDEYTVEECRTMLGAALIEFSIGVNKCLANEERMPDKTYAAMVSLAYNIGVGGFCGSTVVRRANAGDLTGACNAFLMLNRAGGRVVRGLVNRRNEERAMCLEGVRDGVVTG